MSNDTRRIDKRFSLRYLLQYFEFTDKILLFLKQNNNDKMIPFDIYDDMLQELLSEILEETNDKTYVTKVKNALSREMLCTNKTTTISTDNSHGESCIVFPSVVISFLQFSNDESRALLSNEYEAHNDVIRSYRIQIKQIHQESLVTDKIKDLFSSIQKYISNVEWDIEESVSSLDFNASHIVTNKYRTIQERRENYVTVNNLYNRNVEPLYRFTNTEGQLFSKEVKTILNHINKFPIFKKYHDDIYQRFSILMNQASKVPPIRKRIYEYLAKEKEDLEFSHGLEFLRKKLNDHIKIISDENLRNKFFGADDYSILSPFNKYFLSGGFKTKRQNIATNTWTEGQIDEFHQYLAEKEGKYSPYDTDVKTFTPELTPEYHELKKYNARRLIIDSLLLPKFNEFLYTSENFNRLVNSNHADVSNLILSHLNETWVNEWIVGDFTYLCLYLISEFQSSHHTVALEPSSILHKNIQCNYKQFYLIKKKEVSA